MPVVKKYVPWTECSACLVRSESPTFAGWTKEQIRNYCESCGDEQHRVRTMYRPATDDVEQLRRMRSHLSESGPTGNRWDGVRNDYGVTVETSDTSNRIKVFGVGESDFLRWLGYRCWSEEEVSTFYDQLGIRHPKASTLRVCLSTGGSIEGDYPEKPFSDDESLAIEKCGGRIVEVSSE